MELGEAMEVIYEKINTGWKYTNPGLYYSSGGYFYFFVRTIKDEELRNKLKTGKELNEADYDTMTKTQEKCEYILAIEYKELSQNLYNTSDSKRKSLNDVERSQFEEEMEALIANAGKVVASIEEENENAVILRDE